MSEQQLECHGKQHDPASHGKSVKQREYKDNVLLNS